MKYQVDDSNAKGSLNPDAAVFDYLRWVSVNASLDWI